MCLGIVCVDREGLCFFEMGAILVQTPERPMEMGFSHEICLPVLGIVAHQKENMSQGLKPILWWPLCPG